MDQNSIHAGIYSRFKTRNAGHHLVQNRLSSSFLPQNIKIDIYIYIYIILLVLYECKSWSLTLREERRLRVFENRVLRRIFGPKRNEVRGEWRKLHSEELNDLYCLMICTAYQILFG